MIENIKDTICAVSTPKGVGAIAIIRLSGADSIKIADTIFDGKIKISHASHASITHGHIVHPQHKQDMVDEVLVAKFERPHSFTGQDVVEINCHGGLYVVQEILDLLLVNGARLAEPGEFTMRAFLNGKIDLLQAESIADVIDAQTALSLKFAQQQLSGILSKRLLDFKESLKKQLVLLEIELDFSEEDIEFASREDMLDTINGLLEEIDRLISSFKFGKIIREGVHLALVGKPNVGKSTVLNRLLEEERAIVSEIPGTTRDVIQESLDIDGVLFKVSDTAGLRLTKDVVESKGVERTKKTVQQADVVLFIIDASEPLDVLDYEALDVLNLEKIVLLINKIDITGNNIDPEFVKGFQDNYRVSAKTGDGFDAFKKELVRLGLTANIESEVVFNKVRHRDALRRSKEFILHAHESINNKLSSEFVAMDVRAALDTLGEITGEVTTDDILKDIFSSFCIGK